EILLMHVKNLNVEVVPLAPLSVDWVDMVEGRLIDLDVAEAPLINLDNGPRPASERQIGIIGIDSSMPHSHLVAHDEFLVFPLPIPFPDDSQLPWADRGLHLLLETTAQHGNVVWREGLTKRLPQVRLGFRAVDHHLPKCLGEL